MSSNIEVKLDVLNQKASPALYAAPLANRPAASFTGRLFVDSDSPSTGIYRDTGTTWIQVADQGAGTTGTLEQVTTNGNTTDKGILITAGGLNANNIVLKENTGTVKTTNISQIMANNDIWEIYGIGTNTSGNGEGEMVFSLGDDGAPFATGGERFRFTYGTNIVTGTPKNVFIVDYNLSYFNTSVGINTETPTADLDVHSNVNVIGQFNQLTSTNNSLISFQNNSVGLWRIGNYYNSGTNDFGIFDVTNTINRITVKNTGQTFIGTDTTSSGLLVVNSNTSDNHIVCIGTNAPSVRLRNTGTSPTLNAGLGISTATNNFIQGSASGNYCIFNASTTASPILFGVYDSGAGNTQEAVRISAARNFLVGGVTDNGQKLQITGNAAISSTLKINGASGGLSLDVLSTSTFDGIRTYNTNSAQGADIRIGNDANNNLGFLRVGGSASGGIYQNSLIIGTGGGYDIKIAPNGSLAMSIFNSTNNILIGGGSDAGYKLDIGGSCRVQNSITLTAGVYNYIGSNRFCGAANGSYNYLHTGATALSILNQNDTGVLMTMLDSGVTYFYNAVNIGNSVTASIAAPSTHKVSILINGVQYYLLASNV